MLIDRRRPDVAATGPTSPIPPGIPALPGPGEYYASPEMAKLLANTPAAQLGDRYPGTLIGIIGAAALPSPDTLAIVVGRDVSSLRTDGNARLVTRISTTSPISCSGNCAPTVGTDADGMTLVLSVVVAALLFPVLVFIGGATRLSAARREQRFAAMRLLGATPGQISTIATVESSVATIVGVAIGFLLFAALRPLIASIPFSGERFFTSDLSLSATNVALVAIGVPVAAAMAARVALRRVTISPLGVSRRVTPRPPRPRRTLLLFAGIAWLTYLAVFSDIRTTWTSIHQAYGYLAGVFAIMIGLVVAGPWLTALGSRLTARRTRRPAGLIAARRLSDNPHAAFRAVSGVVLAVFVASCAIGIITTIVASNSNAGGVDAADARRTILRDFFRTSDVDDAPTAVPPDAQHDLEAIAGVESVTTIHAAATAIPTTVVDGVLHGVPRQYITCADLVAAPALGHCPRGAQVVGIEADFGGGVIDHTTPMSDITWRAADVTTDQLATMPIDTIVVTTDGSTAAIEHVRTTLERVFPKSLGFAPQTVRERNARSSRQIDRYRQLADVVLLASLPIAGCSLAVCIVGGLAERRRPFSLLRLTGAPLGVLRRVVGLEAAVPLLLSVVVAAGTGLLAAALFLHAQLQQTLQAPTLGYYALIIGGVVASLAVIASTLPLLARLTGPDGARND